MRHGRTVLKMITRFIWNRHTGTRFPSVNRITNRFLSAVHHQFILGKFPSDQRKWVFGHFGCNLIFAGKTGRRVLARLTALSWSHYQLLKLKDQFWILCMAFSSGKTCQVQERNLQSYARIWHWQAQKTNYIYIYKPFVSWHMLGTCLASKCESACCRSFLSGLPSSFWREKLMLVKRGFDDKSYVNSSAFTEMEMKLFMRRRRCRNMQTNSSNWITKEYSTIHSKVE